MKLVMKFGGTSLADKNALGHAVDIIKKHSRKRDKIVVVVSAISGITDKLYDVSEKALKNDQSEVRKIINTIKERHINLIASSIKNSKIRKDVLFYVNQTLDDLEKVLTGISYIGEISPRSLDYLLSFGEKLSAPIVSGAIRDTGLISKHVTGMEAGIVTDNNYGDAKPLMNVTKNGVKQTLEPILAKGTIPVITGYIGGTQEGHTTTLGRGGSDYTATILGSALDFDEVWIWTDVNGIMTTDPKIVRIAKTIPELSFREAIEMAVFGAKAIHPRALEPVIDQNIPVRVKNTFNPNNKGTLIFNQQKIKAGEIVKAVSIIQEVSLINISGAGMAGAPGVAAKIFNILSENNINILMISQSASEANISLVVMRGFLDKAVSALEIALLGQDVVREITYDEKISVIAIIGAGMKGAPGVAGRIFGAIAKKGINVIMISQGSSEVNISFVVKEREGKNVVKLIHNEFKLYR
jgi:aspartate kinase